MPFSIIDELLNSGFEQDAEIHSASGSKPIKVIFKNEYELTTIKEINWQGSNPIVICRSADVELVEIENDHITINGINNNEAFKIIEVKPNGNGQTILELSYD